MKDSTILNPQVTLGLLLDQQDAQYKLAQYLLPFAASDKHDTDENLMLVHWMNEVVSFSC